MSVEIAKQNLLDVRKILNELGITFWLEAGTLLALVRGGELFSHDWQDQDIGIYGEDCEKLINNLDKFKDIGFGIYHIFEHPCKKGTEIAISRNGSKIDIFTKPKRDGYRWWLSFRKIDDKWDYIPHKYEARFYNKLHRIKKWDVIWNIPSDTFNYLEGTYGEWQTPNHDWEWWKDPKCIDRRWEIK